MTKNELIIQERIAKAIYLIRNQKVMMDSELAEMYGVETKVLNQAVKRNIDRFPEDFMFQLTNEEWENLKSQFVTSSETNSFRSQFVTFKIALVKEIKHNEAIEKFSYIIEMQ
jgi:predicted XRE-type DNA-binding protein